VWHGVEEVAKALPDRIERAPAIILEADRPAEVFRSLRRVLIPLLISRERMIVDITGGKKSMVAGALLFGAFAGIQISYVDFDEYDAKDRVPLGYTCRIGELKNPYQIFRLKDWDRVRVLYEGHFFHSAAALLADIRGSMDTWFDRKDIEAAERLQAAMALYGLWDNGDYSTAYEKGQELRLPLPTAVDVLGQGRYWPQGPGAEELLAGLRKVEETLYRDEERLVVYARDEEAKIGRLIDKNEDFRSALLRAVGLTEVLFRSRMLLALEQGKLEVDRGDGYRVCSDLDEATRAELRSGIIELESVYPFVQALRYDPKGNNEQRNRHVELRNKWRLRRSSTAPKAPKADEALKQLRNKATHTYLSVPRSVAAESLRVARENVKDYVDNWATPSKQSVTGAPAWEELCRRCGVEFLAPGQ
jgi:hypothetical protein